MLFEINHGDRLSPVSNHGAPDGNLVLSRWVQRLPLLLADAARPCRHAVGNRWQVDETYVKVAGQGRYVYRVVDPFGQVVDVLVSAHQDVRRPPVLSARDWRDQGHALNNQEAAAPPELS